MENTRRNLTFEKKRHTYYDVILCKEDLIRNTGVNVKKT